MKTTSFDQIVSRRSALGGLGAGGLAIAVASRRISAQDSDTLSLVDHPLVGSWLVIAPEPVPSPTSGPALNAFTSDGIFIQIDPLRGNSIGSWKATGERTAVVTLVFLSYFPNDHTVFQSLAVGRDLIEVDDTGSTFTGQGELEFRSAEGTTIDGPFGPLSFSGRRIQVEQLFNVPSQVATPSS